MPRTTFVDGVTRLLSTWLNKVDATVVDGHSGIAQVAIQGNPLNFR